MSRFVIHCSWDEVPHLTKEQKEELWNSFPEYQRQARFAGVPVLGSGAIYQVPEDDITVEPFPLPEHYVQAFGMDVGWQRTAVVWGAKDLESGVTYLYDVYYRGKVEPSVHADAIRARGQWIPGAIDPMSRGRSPKDGVRLLSSYREMGLNLFLAENSVEAGILQVWRALSTGRIKIFKTCQPLLAEYRIYRRDADGKVVKKNDHAMDAMRYLWMSGIQRAIVEPIEETPDPLLTPHYRGVGENATGWMRG